MPELDRQLAAAAEACREALAAPELVGIRAACGRLGLDSARRAAALRSMWRYSVYPQSLRPLLASLDAGDPARHALERCLVLETTLENLGRVPGLPVYEPVRLAFCREFRFFADPGPWVEQFQPGSYPLRAHCGIALLERFPAGQFSWESTGVPRSWLWRVGPLRLPGLLYELAFRLRGLKPCLGTHISITRAPFRLLVEKEYYRSYYWLARSLERQPEFKGIIACSWLYSADIVHISPHLAWMRNVILENGGFAAEIGEAGPDAGFLDGSPRRRKLYESGKIRPQEAFVIWPRAAFLDWALRHPEFDGDA